MLITDFGTARDWSNQSRSVTVGDPGAYSRLYAAPEVILEDSRSSSADIWSLGCVYLDMTTVLNGATLEDKFRFFEDSGTFRRSPADNLQTLYKWCSQLSLEGREKQPVKWIQQMMRENCNIRPTAASVLDQILACHIPHIYYSSCCNEHDESADDASYQASESDDSIIALPRNGNINAVLVATSDGVVDEKPFTRNTSSHEAEIQGQNENRTQNENTGAGGVSTPSGSFGIDKAFLRAAGEGRETVIQFLLENGVNIAAKDEYERTALHLAAEKGHEAVARLLLEKGADIAAKNDDGWTVLHLAARNGHEAVASLLLEKGADVAAKDSREWTALHLAAIYGHEAMARLLLEKGVDVAAIDCDGWTALRLAREFEHWEVASLL